MRRHGRTFTPEQAAHLRWIAHNSKLSARELARHLRADPRSIQRLLTGESFPDAGGPTRPKMRARARRVLTRRDAATIRRLRGKRPWHLLAARYGCSRSTIYHVWNRRVWR